jgi:hypothetical protein
VRAIRDEHEAHERARLAAKRVSCRPMEEPSSLEKMSRLAKGHGALTPGRGMASGVLALTLAVLALLGVIGFHFPAYTSTPELRAQYDVETLR